MGVKKAKVDSNFWLGKKVFLTGHTGFKGSWLSLWLQEMGAITKGYSLNVNTVPSLFIQAKVEKNMISEIGDIRDLKKLTKSITSFSPDILIHMAAQPIVRLSYTDPVNTYTTNLIGTVNIFEAARKCSRLKAIVNVTSDKCYENKKIKIGYKENDPMGGFDPYSSSKGCAELITSAYRNSFFNNDDTPYLASARAGNVIGGGDWAEDRLVPDILKAFQKSKTVIIRNPNSIRPWQHVLEPLSGYLCLAQELYISGKKFAEPWNFGPKYEDCKTVSWILDKMVKGWSGNVNWKLDKSSNPHEALLLKLNCSKAEKVLKWTPKWNLNYAINLILDWHKTWLAGNDIKQRCLEEIKLYQID